MEHGIVRMRLSKTSNIQEGKGKAKRKDFTPKIKKTLNAMIEEKEQEDETHMERAEVAHPHMDKVTKGKVNSMGKKNYLWEERKERQKETSEDISSKFFNLQFVPLEGGKIQDLLYQILEQEEDVIIEHDAQSRESRRMASRRNGQCLQYQLGGMDNANQEKHLMHHLATVFIIVTPYLGSSITISESDWRQFWSWQPHSLNSCRPVYDKMNYKGLAAGGSRGSAPMARIAVYKTCWDSGCYDVDLLAAFDDAIRDGIHILSLSLVVVASVGNEGNQGSATNLAPWMITVAAS
ncbi:hypothetical protein AAG906_018695 [Vitis piasezkii]